MSLPSLKDILSNCYPRWSPTMYRLTLGGAVVAAVALPLMLVAVPFIEFFNGMAAQPYGKTQMTYGRTFGLETQVERPPVPGTLPRAYHPYAFEAQENTIEAARQVGAQLVNPLPITLEHLRRGQGRFNIYCAVCHGPRAEGNGPVIGPERFPAPPSLHTKQATEYLDGTLFHIMTKGMGKMPSYADKLEPVDRWLVAHYLCALQRAQAPKPEDLTP